MIYQDYSRNGIQNIFEWRRVVDKYEECIFPEVNSQSKNILKANIIVTTWVLPPFQATPCMAPMWIFWEGDPSLMVEFPLAPRRRAE